MFFKNLKLRSFKAIEKADLTFNRINVFTGENGQGKSSALVALNYLMRGELDTKMSDYVKWGASNFEIESDFNLFNQLINYKIESRKTTSVRCLTLDKGLEFLGQDASNWMKEQIDPMLAGYSAISLQHQNTSILFEKPAPRLEKLKQIFGVVDVDAKIALMKTDETINRRSSEDKEQALLFMEERKFDYMEEFKIDEDEDQLTRQLVSYQLTQSQFEEQKKTWDSLQREHIIYQSVLDQIKSLRTRIEGANSDRDSAIDILNSEKDLAFDLTSYEQLQAHYRDTQKEWEVYREFDRSVSTLQIQLQRVQTEQQDVDNNICPTCKQKLHDHELKNKYKGAITDIETKITALGNSSEPAPLLHIEKQLKGMEENRRVYDRAQQRLITAHAKVTLNDGLLDNWNSELNNLISNMVNPGEQLEEPVVPGDVALIPGLTEKIVTLKARKEELKRIEDHNASIRKEQRRQRVKMNELEADLSELRGKNSILTEGRKFLEKEFTAHLITTGTEYVSWKMNEFFQKAYGGRYSIAFEQTKRSIDFIYSSPEGSAGAIMASGFEQALLASSFRLALCGLQPLGVLVLDEIDADASGPSSLRLYQALLAEESIEQFFVVTHNPETLEYLMTEPTASVFTVKEGRIE